MRNSFIQTFIMEEEKQQCVICKRWESLSNFIGAKNVPVKCCSKCRTYATEYQNKKKSENEEAFKSRHTETVRVWRAKKNTDPAYREIVLEKSRASYDERRSDDAFRAKNAERSMKNFNKNKMNPEFALKRCKMGAKHRGLEWTLTDEDTVEMMTSPCVYCGVLLEINGIDRVDSSIGYVQSNCVPCCKTCNLMKMCLDPTTFVERCRHIAGVEDRPDAWTDKKNVSYKRYLYKSKSQNTEFAITEEEFQTLTSGACAYCARQNSTTHRNGIDRVDSAVGYVVENCVPCCGECNVMKKTMTPAEFRDACAAVAGWYHHSGNETIARQRSCIASRKK